MNDELKSLDAILADMHGYFAQVQQLKVPVALKASVETSAQRVSQARMSLGNISLAQVPNSDREHLRGLVQCAKVTCEPLSRLACESHHRPEVSALKLVIGGTTEMTERIVAFCGGPHGGGGSPNLLDAGSSQPGVRRQGGGPHGPGGGKGK